MIGPLVLAVLVAHAVLVSLANATGQPPAAAQPSVEAPWPPAGVSRPGGDVTKPRLVKEFKPKYTADAMRAKVQGTIGMEAIILPDGTVGEVRVTRSLDREYGLDDEAVRTLKQWRFKPGTKDGVAVPVLVEVEMEFWLKK